MVTATATDKTTAMTVTGGASLFSCSFFICLHTEEKKSASFILNSLIACNLGFAYSNEQKHWIGYNRTFLFHIFFSVVYCYHQLNQMTQNLLFYSDEYYCIVHFELLSSLCFYVTISTCDDRVHTLLYNV